MYRRFFFALAFAYLVLPALALAQQYATNFQGALLATPQAIRTCPANISAGCAAGWVQCYNPNASIAYVQLWDQTATPTVGTTAPKLSIGLAAQATSPAIYLQARLLNKLWAAATTTATGNTAPGSALVCNFGIQ